MWTLQELIAPKHMAFFDRDWKFLGTKHDLLDQLSTITRIDKAALRNGEDLSAYTIAKKMSWAAERSSTRIEDVAYSLVGIFNVNMPLLYGEGRKAFIRLQEEIMKHSADQSLFAWGYLKENDKSVRLPNARWKNTYLGFLAESPDDFRMSADVEGYSTDQNSTWMTTNKGIQVNFPLAEYQVFRTWFQTETVMLLNCYLGDNIRWRLGIALKDGPEGSGPRFRAHDSLVLVDEANFTLEESTPSTTYLARNDDERVRPPERLHGILVKPNGQFYIVDAKPANQWNAASRMFLAPDGNAQSWNIKLCIAEHKKDSPRAFIVLLKICPDKKPHCRVQHIRGDGIINETALAFFNDVKLDMQCDCTHERAFSQARLAQYNIPGLRADSDAHSTGDIHSFAQRQDIWRDDKTQRLRDLLSPK